MPTVPLLGRDAELTRLDALLDRTRAASGAVVAVHGEAGIGKTRFAEEAAVRAQCLGYEVLMGAAPSPGLIYGAIDDLIRQALDLPQGASASLRTELRARVAKLHLSATDSDHLAALLGASVGGAWHELDPRARSVNNRIALKSFLRARTGSAPQLVIIDDMHWADELTRDVVRGLSTSVVAMPVAVLLLHGPGYRPPHGTEEVPLGAMGVEALVRVLRGVAGRAPAPLETAVIARADGSPLYVEEAMLLLLDGGILTRGADGPILDRPLDEADLPASLALLLAARVDHLPSLARRAAQVAATIGRGFTRTFLVRVADDECLAPGLDELCTRGILCARRRGAEDVYAFRHALTGDVAYATLGEEERRALHSRIAETMAIDLGPDVDRHGAELAHHWHQAGDRRRARAGYLAAARRAVEWNAPAEAETLYRTYATLDPDDGDRLTAQLEMATEAMRPLGRWHEAREIAQDVASAARDRLDPLLETHALLFMADVDAELGAEASSRARLDDALRVASGAANDALRAEVLRRRAIYHHRHGQLAAARSSCEEELALRRRLGDQAAEGTAIANLAVAEKELGRLEEALSLYRQALAIHRARGRRQMEGATLANMAVVRMEQGHLEEARGLYEEALAIHRSVGDRRFEGITLGNLANLRRVQATPFNHVRVIYEQALALHREVRDRAGEGRVLSNLAGLHEEHRDTATAIALLEEALSIQREVGSRRSEGITLGNLAKLRGGRGDVEQALRDFDEALRIDRDVGDRRSVGHALLDRAQLYRRAFGRLDVAETEAREAETILAEVGDGHGAIHALCELGHIQLARGNDASQQLARLRADAIRLDIDFAGVTGAVFAQFRQALAASKEGTALFRGDLPTALPAGLREWLVARGELAHP